MIHVKFSTTRLATSSLKTAIANKKLTCNSTTQNFYRFHHVLCSGSNYLSIVNIQGGQNNSIFNRKSYDVSIQIILMRLISTQK